MTPRARECGPLPELVSRLLTALPDWFGQPEANEQYVRDAHHRSTLVACTDDGDEIGVLLYRAWRPGAEPGVLYFDQAPAATVDIHVMAVDPSYHRRGAGTALIGLVADVAVRLGARALTVATLGPSDPDPFYARTRAFYEAQGFVPVEERTDVWPGSPRVLMVRLLG